MNLVEAILRASKECINQRDYNSYEAYLKFKSYSPKEKKLINDFFDTLLNNQFNELLNWCGGVINKPITRSISIMWTIEQVKEVRLDLNDEQASKILETLLYEYNPLTGRLRR